MARRQEVKEDLIENDQEFRRLYEEHQNHERHLDEISRNPSPTTDDEIAVKGIKVHKLRLKDRMETIIESRL